ncbi:MAG TPA: hypothetical protein VFS60_12405, partial [Thermoanaerobaculia bacterium]|nr:hypothetical protein [Thermoanaerobaculia bacterium]
AQPLVAADTTRAFARAVPLNSFAVRRHSIRHLTPMSSAPDPATSARVAMRSTALDDESLSEVGRIVANFALLEVYLLVLIHGLLKVPPSLGRLITTEQPFRSLVALAANLVRERSDPAIQTEFRGVLTRIRSAEQRRNQIVHSVWGGAEHYVLRTKYSAKESKGLVVRRERMTVADLHQVAYDIAEASLELERFTNRQGIGTSLPFL